jgi:hypothetical protein
MVSRHAAFVGVVAQRGCLALDQLFESTLLTEHSIASVVSFSIAGYLFITSWGLDRSRESIPIVWCVALLGIATFVCGAAPLISPRFRRLPKAVLRVAKYFAALLFMGMIMGTTVSLLIGEEPIGFPSIWGQHTKRNFTHAKPLNAYE